MQIKNSDEIAGYSLLEIRKLMRKGRERAWNVYFVQEIMDLSDNEAQHLINELVEQEYIEADQEYEGEQYWKTTLKGNRLALASAAKPIKRSTADRLLKEFIGRVEELNNSDYYLFSVSRARVFGSYLSEKESLGDLDIIVDILPRYSDRDKQLELERQHTAKAKMEGRKFSNFVEELFWPYTEVLLFLKNRSKSLSLHSEGVDCQQ